MVSHAMEQSFAALLIVWLLLASMHSWCDHRPSSRVLHMQDACFVENDPNVVLDVTDGYDVVMVKVKVNEVLDRVAGDLLLCKYHLVRSTYAAVRLEYDLRMLHLDRHDDGSDRGSMHVSTSQSTILKLKTLTARFRPATSGVSSTDSVVSEGSGVSERFGISCSLACFRCCQSNSLAVVASRERGA